MGFLFGGGGGAEPVKTPPPPQADDATAQINAEDQKARQTSRRSTILTSDDGLPNLGATSVTGQ